MTYAQVVKEFKYLTSRKEHRLGDIPTLNFLIRTGEHGLTKPDVEALLLDLAPEYATYTLVEQEQILTHSFSLV